MASIVENILQANADALIKGLNCKSGLLDYLLAHDDRSILSRTEEQHILSKATRYEQNEVLVTTLMTKENGALAHLHRYLKHTGYTAMASQLEKSAEKCGYKFSTAGGGDSIPSLMPLSAQKHASNPSAKTMTINVPRVPSESSQNNPNVLSQSQQRRKSEESSSNSSVSGAEDEQQNTHENDEILEVHL